MQSIAIQQDIAASIRQNNPISWDYDLLCSWLKQQKINRTELLEIITSMVIEVLFDLMQGGQVSCHFYPHKKVLYPSVLLDPEQTIVTTWKSWQNWHRSTLGSHSPNEAPVIKSLEKLKKRSSAKTYEVLSKYIDGNRSLRDLAVYMEQDVLRLTSSLALYIQLGLINLKEIKDLPQPLTVPQEKSLAHDENKLIACVDDNPRMCQLMKDIIAEAGHQFLGINDSSKVIPLCFIHQPNLIFIDLEMLGIDSWKVCRKLRNSKALQQRPIIVLVGQKGVWEPLHNKISGSSAFISKPLSKEDILDTILQHLP
ncbi:MULTISPECIES: response regulator [Crocosphaera]|uniref:response regulator n=2 Tax=Aphanothecaceae TaxID=1890450 RepID=UPI00257F20AE|nr:response regulator [Crocosphaera sp.]NQZ62168.1 response regulator [Crocosphaera sp.]